jgi:hypothetical protein
LVRSAGLSAKIAIEPPLCASGVRFGRGCRGAGFFILSRRCGNLSTALSCRELLPDVSNHSVAFFVLLYFVRYVIEPLKANGELH